MPHILGIVGSPKKRSTHALVKAALRAAGRGDKTRVELVHLSDMKVNHCRGCGYCKETLKCKIDDSMRELNLKLTEADAIIIGTPTYFWDVTGLLKNFIDRTHPLYLGQKLRGKKGAAIVTAASTGQGKALSTVESFFQLHKISYVGGVTISLRRKNLHGKDTLSKGDFKMAASLGTKVFDALAQQEYKRTTVASIDD